MTERADDHLTPLGDTGWWVWRECKLRSAGFPAAGVEALGDGRLAAAVDRSIAHPDAAAGLDAEFEAATARLSVRIRDVAADPRFREAVAWQNLALLHTAVDKVAAGTSKPAKRRSREMAVASYLQRYTVKNETIGSFGPLASAQVTGAAQALTVTVGDHLLARRRVYFEHWAIDSLAHRLSQDPELVRWLTPTPMEANQISGDVVHRPRGTCIILSPTEAALLALCDGQRTVQQIADQAQVNDLDLLAAVDRLRAQRVIRLDLAGPVEAEPESTLRRKLMAVQEPGPRRRALAALDEMVDARDEVAAAAGVPDRLGAALDRLNEVFERVTGQAANRRSGEMYAGRTVVYEDTVRDVAVEIGQPLIDALAAPLGLLLHSVSWLVGQAAIVYQRRFLDLFERCRSRLGTDSVPISALLASAAPDLAYSPGHIPPLVAALVPELQHRWAEILAIPAGTRRHAVRSDLIADAVHALFAPAAPRWSSAIHHSPDVMIAAASVDAVNRGDYLLVLGELHMAANTFDSRYVVAQHPQPDRLLAADERDRAGFRVLPVPAKESSSVNSRTYPPVLLSPQYTYWCSHSVTTGAPGPIAGAAGMTVERDGGRLTVRFPHGGLTLDLLEVLGEYLSGAVMNGFRPVRAGRHRPRVLIDRLAIARESWTFEAGRLGWAFAKDDRQRFKEARAWRHRTQLPERAFYRATTEDKPVFVDFTSIALVNILAKLMRQSSEWEPTASVTFSEMLPGLEHSWLHDAAGSAYTSELRFVAVDPSARVGK